MAQPYFRDTKLAFSNSGVSLGLQAVGAWPERVAGLNSYFESFRHTDDPELDTDAITHVMACTSHFPGLMLPSGGSAAPPLR